MAPLVTLIFQHETSDAQHPHPPKSAYSMTAMELKKIMKHLQQEGQQLD
jgi:hypothetical protein